MSWRNKIPEIALGIVLVSIVVWLVSEGSGSFQLTVSQGKVSLNAQEAPVAAIFEDLSRKTGIQIENRLNPEQKVTTVFNNVPLAQAIAKLGSVAIVYGTDRNKPGTQIARIIVSAKGTKMRSQSNTMATPTTAASKGSEAGAPARPFAFEFDPSKVEEQNKNPQ